MNKKLLSLTLASLMLSNAASLFAGQTASRAIQRAVDNTALASLGIADEGQQDLHDDLMAEIDAERAQHRIATARRALEIAALRYNQCFHQMAQFNDGQDTYIIRSPLLVTPEQVDALLTRGTPIDMPITITSPAHPDIIFTHTISIPRDRSINSVCILIDQDLLKAVLNVHNTLTNSLDED